jgi:DNA helicase-2/ATP-dependent DNA helicase PcrA
MYQDIGPSNGGITTTRALVQAYESAWAQTQEDPPGFPETDVEKSFQQQLIDWHVFHESMLIGEIIPYLVRYLKDNPQSDEHTEFKHLLADEYQDMNKAEQTAIAYLSGKCHICIVGDDDQSIYSFKHAHPDGIRQWKTIHPTCADFEMTECQRCPTSVVEIANSLIAYNKNRTARNLTPIDSKGKGNIEIVQLSNPSVESKWIAKKIKELFDKTVQPSDVIVLVQRKRAASVILEALKAEKIPAKSYYEESQLESDQAQIRFSIFKLLLNRNDRVALRYLIGLDSSTFRANPYAKLREHCESSGDSPYDALEKLSAGVLKLKNSTTIIEQFDKIKKALTDLERHVNDVQKLVDALFPADVSELADLRELALLAKAEATDAAQLFTFMMKEITQPDIPPEVKEVRVMSLHKSKGLSSPYVFVAQCIQGVLPQIAKPGTPKAEADAAIEEQRRLFFVGITRVKAGGGHVGTLFLTYPKAMQSGMAKQQDIPFTKEVYGQAQLSPSIFIQELGKSAPGAIAGTV